MSHRGLAFVVFSLVHALVLGSFPATLFAAVEEGAVDGVRPSDDVLTSTPWFDAERKRVVPVDVVPRADDSLNRDSRWLPKAERVRSQAAPVTPTATSTGTSLGPQVVGWVFLTLVLLLVVGVFVYIFSRAEIELGAGSTLQKRLNAAPDEQTLARMQELPAELRHMTGNLRDQTLQLMQANRFDLAIITLFGHQLLLLDHAAMLRLTRGKTNGRYVRETRAASGAAAAEFQNTVAAFERCYFGRYSLTRDEMESLWQSNLVLESIVHERQEVAA